MTHSLVAVESLTKRFGSKTAVNDISFSVREHERVGLLGPNGAGKSTTLLMLLGAIVPDYGSIIIRNRKMPKHRSEIMQSVGFAAGYLPLPKRLTVFECLRFFARLYGIRKPDSRVAEMLAFFGIPHLSKQQIDTLSSGQRTLVGIAKAMLHRPDLLILDEPTASLDPDVADRVQSAVSQFHAEYGTTLLLTSHDMTEVERLCDRVLFLQNGSILADGDPVQLATQYEQDDLNGVFLHVARNAYLEITESVR